VLNIYLFPGICDNVSVYEDEGSRTVRVVLVRVWVYSGPLSIGS
jgi:hypothetical protein